MPDLSGAVGSIKTTPDESGNHTTLKLYRQCAGELYVQYVFVAFYTVFQVAGGASHGEAEVFGYGVVAVQVVGAGSQMQFSNDNLVWSAVEAYALTKDWTLTTGDGTKTVHVKFKDVAGNWMTTAVSDTIILDATPPQAPRNFRMK